MTNLAKQFYLFRKAREPYSQRQLADDLDVGHATAERWCAESHEPAGIAQRRVEKAIKAWERAESRRKGEKVRVPRD